MQRHKGSAQARPEEEEEEEGREGRRDKGEKHVYIADSLQSALLSRGLSTKTRSTLISFVCV